MGAGLKILVPFVIGQSEQAKGKKGRERARSASGTNPPSCRIWRAGKARRYEQSTESEALLYGPKKSEVNRVVLRVEVSGAGGLDGLPADNGPQTPGHGDVGE